MVNPDRNFEGKFCRDSMKFSSELTCDQSSPAFGLSLEPRCLLEHWLCQASKCFGPYCLTYFKCYPPCFEQLTEWHLAFTWSSELGKLWSQMTVLKPGTKILLKQQPTALLSVCPGVKSRSLSVDFAIKLPPMSAQGLCGFCFCAPFFKKREMCPFRETKQEREVPSEWKEKRQPRNFHAWNQLGVLDSSQAYWTQAALTTYSFARHITPHQGSFRLHLLLVLRRPQVTDIFENSAGPKAGEKCF